MTHQIAIVGAGMAGLAAAHRLRATRPDLQTVLFEKSRGPGGRAATRRFQGATFDHGAQYVKTPTPELQNLLLHTLPSEQLRDIRRPIWVFDGDGRISRGDPAQNADPKWTYTEGLTRLAKELARGLEIRPETRVALFRAAPDGYTLVDEAGQELLHANAIMLTPPAPQSAEIVGRSTLLAERRDMIVEELGKASYRPCLSVTLGYDRRPQEPAWYALVNTDRRHPISWLAFEHLKPERGTGGQGVLIAQMAPGWSREHWDDRPEALADATAKLVSELLDQDLRRPRWFNRQGWRYALPDSGCGGERLHTGDGLFFAGDYLAGQGRVHLAIESGWQAAERIAEYFPAARP